MVKHEWKQCIAVLKNFYTSPNFLPDIMSWDVWYEGLKDIPYEILKASIVAYSQTKYYPPTVADLREQAYNLIGNDSMSDMQAWSLVSKAARNSTYHSEEEFKQLPANIQKAIGSHTILKEWAMMDEDKFSIAQAQFLKAFRSVQEREKNINLLSQEVRTAFGIGCAEHIQIEPKKENEVVKEENTYTPPEDKLAEIRRRLGRL